MKETDRNEEMSVKQEMARPDMGSGSVRKLLAKLAVPAVVAQIVNMLYSVVDRIYIGHIPEVGSSALTGVGLFMPILMLLNAFAMLVGSGGAPRVGIALGRGDSAGAQRTMGNCFTLLLLLAAVFTAVFYAAAPSLLLLFGASEVTLPYALEYARIYILGSVFVLIVMGMNPFITTQGFAKFSMLTTVIGAVINIALDPIFIFWLDWGVRGAAVATVLSQAVGAAWVLRFLTGKRTLLRITAADMRLSGRVFGPVLALGVSTFVMLATESVLSVSFTASLAEYGGDIAVGAMTVITSVSLLVTQPLSGVCQGGGPIISFNFGAGKNDRVKQAFYAQFTVCAVYAGVFWLALLAVPQVFAGIFSSDTALVSYTAWAMRIYMAGIIGLGLQLACQQGFMALGQAKISLLLACLRKVFLLIPLIFLLPLFFENKVFAVFLAEPVSDILAATVTVVLFFTRFPSILKNGPKK